jgi:hypothetical protein
MMTRIGGFIQSNITGNATLVAILSKAAVRGIRVSGLARQRGQPPRLVAGVSPRIVKVLLFGGYAESNGILSNAAT